MFGNKSVASLGTPLQRDVYKIMDLLVIGLALMGFTVLKRSLNEMKEVET